MSEQTKLGFNELEDIVFFAADLGNAIGKSLEDNKIQITDLVNFVPALTKLPAAIAGAEKVKEEFADLDESEKAELLQIFQDEFDIPQEHAEKFVEDALEISIKIYSFAKTWFF